MENDSNNDRSATQKGFDHSILESLSIGSDVLKWYGGKGEDFFRKIGLKGGNFLLDFGCRVGNYAIPAAKVVGNAGKVYALDKNHSAVDELMHRARVMNLDEVIVPMKTGGEFEIDLEDNSIDYVLFYDIIRSLFRIDGTLEPYRQLLNEFGRILKQGGVFSLFIKHLHSQSVGSQEVLTLTESFFSYDETKELDLMHWDSLETGTIHNLRKT